MVYVDEFLLSILRSIQRQMASSIGILVIVLIQFLIVLFILLSQSLALPSIFSSENRKEYEIANVLLSSC